MATISVQAREYEKGRDMMTSYAAARRALWEPENAMADLGIDLKRRAPEYVPPPKPQPHVCISDDQYAELLSALAVYGRIPGNKARLVCNIVSTYYGIPVAEIVSRRRNANLVTARHVAMYILVRGFKYSFPQTALALGKRDHTSSLHGFRNVSRKIEADAAFGEEVAGLMRACGV